MITAGVGSMPKVIGNIMAMVAEGPRPGRIPTMVPRKAPRMAIPILVRVRQVENPPIKLVMTSISRSLSFH
jgi:hypothetical protein